jgi:hypothetical protein
MSPLDRPAGAGQGVSLGRFGLGEADLQERLAPLQTGDLGAQVFKFLCGLKAGHRYLRSGDGASLAEGG